MNQRTARQAERVDTARDEHEAKRDGRERGEARAETNMRAARDGRDADWPERERVLEWQAQQAFPICPDPDEPTARNVYRELRFPDHIYENIDEYWTQSAEAESAERPD